MSDVDRQKEKKLSSLLLDAADERPGAAEAFFELLLQSDVWVASMTPTKPGSPEGVTIIGEGKPEEQGIITTDYEGHDCVPIFTEEAFVLDWAIRDVYTSKKSFKSLIWMLGDENWLYLNPNQEVGKEITNWEVELMRKGPDAIPDLVAALGDDGMPDLEVRSDSELFPKLKRRVLPVLELCKNLEEAFMVAVKEDGGKDEKPMIGLKYSSKAESAEKSYIRDELHNVGEQLFADGTGGLIVVDDLGNDYSPNENIFSDATPFYIALKEMGAGKKLISTVTSIFKGRSSKDTKDGKD